MGQVALPAEQIAAKLPFEGLDRTAKGRLGNVALFRSSCKVQGPGNCQEITYLMHFHGTAKRLWNQQCQAHFFVAQDRRKIAFRFPNVAQESLNFALIRACLEHSRRLTLGSREAHGPHTGAHLMCTQACRAVLCDLAGHERSHAAEYLK